MAGAGRKPAIDVRMRDREATERAILAAAKQVLAVSGFQGFGVNAVAREAGCDKQLVYRYFGGMDGLADAIGADLADWWRTSLAAPPERAPPQSYGELMERLALGLMEALRADPLVRKIMAWEISEASPQVARLNAGRSRGMAEWMATQRGSLAPPDGVDAPAVNAVLIAAIQHLVLASMTTGIFAGAELRSEADWERVRTAIRALIASVYPA